LLVPHFEGAAEPVLLAVLFTCQFSCTTPALQMHAGSVTVRLSHWQLLMAAYVQLDRQHTQGMQHAGSC
jgi:hypothetical protein